MHDQEQHIFREVNRRSSLKKIAQHLLLKCLSCAIVTPLYATSLVETVQAVSYTDQPSKQKRLQMLINFVLYDCSTRIMYFTTLVCISNMNNNIQDLFGMQVTYVF